MKTLKTALFIILQLGWLSELSAESKFEYEVLARNKVLKYSVVTKNCPGFEWEKGGEPKLSVGAAVNLARLEARETFQLRTDRVVVRVELRNLTHGGDYWFYCVTFGFPEDGEGAGMVAPITIVVFMDGTVLKPSSVEPAKAK